MAAIGRDPIFIERGAGAELIDVDGNRYVDYVCSWGPLILGHAHPEVLEAIVAAAARGSTFGAPTLAEVSLAEEVARRMPAAQMLRMTSSGTEATMTAVRLARAATGREQILKFAGAYHGHLDSMLAQAGSGLVTYPVAGAPAARASGALPSSSGVPAATAAGTVVVPWNDPAGADRGDRAASPGGDRGRAPAGQHGSRATRGGVPRAPARASRRGRRALGARRGHQRLPGRARRGSGTHGRGRGPRDHGQGHRRRLAGGGGGRPGEPARAARAGRRGLSGRNPVRQPAGDGGRAGDARAARRGCLPPSRERSPSNSLRACARPRATIPSRSSAPPAC